MKALVITGASAGIGLATAKLFLQRGYSVFNLSRRPCPASDVESIRCDLSIPAALQDPLDELVLRIRDSSQIALVHNAAMYVHDEVGNTTDKSFRDVVQTNVLAPNTLNRTLLPRMSAGSAIVYVSSTLGEKAVANNFSYVTTKHAQIGMMRATCQDLVESNIHTACVCPGFTDTEMLRKHVPTDAMPTVEAMSAFNRLATPEEIANCVLFAVENPVVNGAVLHANLGQIER